MSLRSLSSPAKPSVRMNTSRLGAHTSFFHLNTNPSDLVNAMLNYLRVAKLEFAINNERKKSMKALNQILEFSSRVPQFTLMMLINGLLGLMSMGRDWKSAIKYFEQMKSLCQHS